MAPGNDSNTNSNRRSSISKTPQQQQRAISSFFSPKGSPSALPTQQQQRSISSFFSPKTSSSPLPPSSAVQSVASSATKKRKPLLVVASTPATPRTENTGDVAADEPTPMEAEPELPSPHSVIGRRLKVYWPLDDAWYEGCVKRYDEPLHVIQYDDGEEESLCLENEKFEWICSEAQSGKRKKLRKLSFIKSSSIGSTRQKAFETEANGKASRAFKRTRNGAISDCIDDAEDMMSCSDNDDDDVDGNEDDSDWTTKDAKEEESEDDSPSLDSDEDVESQPRKVMRVEKNGSSAKKVTRVSSQRSASKSAKKVTDVGSMPKTPVVDSVAKATVIESTKKTVCTDSPVAEKVFTKINVDHPGSKEALGEKLTDCLSGSIGEAGLHLTGEAAERFGQRSSEKFKFLHKNRKDASGKRPGDPGYDPKTLYLPADFVKGLSAGQRQWWEFKAKHMDKVLFFKMGKFYELFEMDAHIGAQHLELQYMKGEQPHCGFPEKNFEEHAGKLARLGHRVLVVEQVETPEQREQRNMKSGTKDKVVKRDVCAVITKGTIVDGDMLVSTPDAAYLLSAFEVPDQDGLSGNTTIGLCLLDAATSRFMIGQLLDDTSRSRLRLALSELRPVELVKPSGMLSTATEKALKEQTRNPLVTNLTPGLEFWDQERTIKELTLFFQEEKIIKKENPDEDDIPEFLQGLLHEDDKAKAAICALGGCISYLKQTLLAGRVLSSARFELLPGSDPFTSLPLRDNNTTQGENRVSFDLFRDHLEPCMHLDSSALENLEILENNHDGGTSGTLLAQLDHCVTAFGRRLIKQWIVRPLLSPESIMDRQNAVDDVKGVAADAASEFRRDLVKLPDMERLVVRLKTCNEKSGRNAQGVVLYEDAAKKLLREFLSALRGFQTIIHILNLFSSVSNQFKSRRLKLILTPGVSVPDMRPAVSYFEGAFDWAEAESTGRITPHHGVDSDFDEATANITMIKEKLDLYLKEQQEYFQNQGITYVTVGKDRYQLEISESLQKKVPPDFEVVSSRKGFRRYSTSPIKELLQELATQEEKREAALKNIMHGLLGRFCEDYSSWLSAVRVVAELDALISLAIASNSINGSTCKPAMTVRIESQEPFLYAKGLRHPILERNLDGGHSFVPNNVSLGGENHPPFMLLTGPNMGGKSTLLRQVCLAIILAQVGADVPADEFKLSPIDRVFVRMGAKDNIMAAQSTFLVELLETASMLTSATRNSLVALDELGRGTATSDGQAIAHAVLQHLSHNVGCLGLFSTHYHRLATDHANDPLVGLHHMACKVESNDSIERVTFLYKLASGACPKSYGVNVARIAGMPESVMKRATVRSMEMEVSEKERTFKKSEEKLFMDVLQSIGTTSSRDTSVIATFLNLKQRWKVLHATG